jgi:zinc protease
MINMLLFLISVQPIKVNEYDLDNGLKLLVYEDHFAPVVATQIHYRVGSYNEPKGLTGISHLLEHMIFKGTKKYGPKVYDEMIKRSGGEENGFTSTHQTAFFANLNKDRYSIELEMEADRMQNCLIDAVEFVPEKGVVMEERRLGENDPYGSFFELIDLMSYVTHPYRNPVVGYMQDLERITRDDVYQWYRKYYNPANAIIIVSGDIDPVRVLEQVEKYYGHIKGIKTDEPVFNEPPQHGERVFNLKRDVMVPAVCFNYHTVPMNHKDSYALDVLAMILSEGRSSRFEKKLVRTKNWATRVNAYPNHAKYEGTFTIFGVPQISIDIDTLRNGIDDEIKLLQSSGITDEELAKAKTSALAQAVYLLDSPTGIGYYLAYWEITGGGWQGINTYQENIQKVTRDDVQRVVNTYLIEDNRTVGYLLPQAGGEQ